jgi:hypothetical protein
VSDLARARCSEDQGRAVPAATARLRAARASRGRHSRGVHAVHPPALALAPAADRRVARVRLTLPPASASGSTCARVHTGFVYAGTPDAEGSLGGLVEVGRRLDRHLEMAIELGALCRNNPVCAQHRPDQPHEGRHALVTKTPRSLASARIPAKSPKTELTPNLIDVVIVDGVLVAGLLPSPRRCSGLAASRRAGSGGEALYLGDAPRH